MGNIKSKYTKELLQEAVEQSFSVLGVVRYVGGNVSSGSSHFYIKKLIDKYNIDTVHFTGKAHNKGKKIKKRLSAEEILVLDRNSGRREYVERIRRSLDEIGVKRECQRCGVGEDWCNSFLRLEVEHVNGNPVDNRKENLKYLCPNCHSQTETFGSRNSKIKKQKKECIDCGGYASNCSKSGRCFECYILHKKKNKEKCQCYKCGKQISKNNNSGMCVSCSQRNRYGNSKRPSLEQLKKDVEESNYCETGRKYGVSDNTIRKWINKGA